MESPLSAVLPVKLVQDATLQPRYATLYNHRNNKLELSISGGSGYFNIINDENNLVSLSHSPNSKTVIVSPMNDGNATVGLVDLCLDSEVPISSFVRVSSISSLDLIMVNRVELGGKLDAEVVALDIYGHIIPPHSLMDMTAHSQSNIISTKFKEINEHGHSVYTVFGRHLGDTTLRFSASKGGSGDALIYSPAKPVQVFSPLSLHPRNITLIVGAVYQVETKGGPYPDIAIEYKIINETVASTSHTGVVTAEALGTTKLVAQAISEDSNVVYSKDMVIINVIPLTDIRIHAPLTHIETGHSMPLYAMGDVEGQNPLSYATSLPPLSFDWSISNKQIASINKHFTNNGISTTKDNVGIVSLTAKRPGRITITLKTKVTIPSNYPDYQIDENKELSSEIEVQVFETLKLKYPNTDSADLLLTPNSEAKILTNRDGNGKLSYSISNQCPETGSNIITISEDGIVKAGDETGSTTVIVSLTESFGVTQSISILVEVKPIVYMQSTINKFMTTVPGEVVSSVPVGSTFQVSLSYHDNRGRKFNSANTDITFRPSRFDLVGVKHGENNDTIEVSVRGAGQTVLQIWNKKSVAINDFIRIQSGSGIVPDKSIVSLGSHICFSSLVRGLNDIEGAWNSDSQIININPITGEAVAQHIGKAGIVYQISEDLATISDVTVIPIEKVSIISPITPLTTSNIGNSLNVMVSLDGNVQNGPSVACEVKDPIMIEPPFTCSINTLPLIPNVDVKDLISAYPTYVPERGYACKLSTNEDALSLLAQIDLSIYLEVVVISRGQQKELRSGEVKIPFIPAFVVDKSEVTITNEATEILVQVKGISEMLGSLKVTSENLIGADVVETTNSESTLKLTLKENIWALSSPPEQTIVIVQSSVTNQLENITVSLEQVGSGTCALPERDVSIINFLMTFISHYKNLFFSMLCIMLTVACIIVGYKALLEPGYRQTQQSGVFASSKAPAPTMSPASPGQTLNKSGLGSDSIIKKLNYSAASPSPRSINLWSIDTEPVYGAPHFRSSPKAAYDGSPTYGSL